MKILSISNMDIWPDGENKGIPSIFYSQAIFAQKHDVFFLCPARHKQTGTAYYKGIKIFRFKMPFARAFGKINLLPLDKFWPHLKSTLLSNLQWLIFQILSLFWAIRFSLIFKPDIIYAHSLVSSYSAWLASKLFGTRLVFRVYGTDNLYWAYQRPLSRIKGFRDYLAFKLNPDYFIITKDGTRAELLARFLGVPLKKIISYRNAIDFDIYKPDNAAGGLVYKKLGINENSKIILSLARLTPFYGMDKLIPLLAELFESSPDAVCIIANSGPEENRLKKLASKYNIADRIFFPGLIERQSVAQLLNICDIYISISSYSNTNNALFEAMACARCIVAVRDGSIEEILTHKKDAILISREDLFRLPAMLNEILSDASLRRILGSQAQIRSRQILETWPQRIGRELEMLEALVKSK